MLSITAFYPGYMSPDSIANLTQGRTGVFHDLNSPLMSWLWGCLDGLFAGPATMLILHNALFWSGSLIFWITLRKRSLFLAYSIVLLGFFPQILSQLSSIWKDVSLAVSLYLAAAILFRASREPGSKLVFLTPVLLFYAYAMRLNAFPAVLPFFVWTAIVICRMISKVRPLRQVKLFLICFTFVYLTLSTALVAFVNSRLTRGRTDFPHQQILLYDLAAISIERGESLFPAYIVENRNFSFEKLKTSFDVRSVNRLIYGSEPALALSTNQIEIDLLEKAWLDAVKNNKYLYFRHRAKIFAQLIGFTRQSITMPFWDRRFSDNPPEFRPEPNFLNNALTFYFRLFRKIGPFHAFIFLLMSPWLILISVQRKLKGDWTAVFVLSLSSVLFLIAYFPTAPSTEYRYVIWSQIAGTLAALFFIDLKVKEHRTSCEKIKSL